MPKPRIHRTPREAVTECTVDVVQLSEATFQIERPVSRDLFFDHPAVRTAYEEDEFIPYWTELWPSAWLLAQAVLNEPWHQFNLPLEALEIACGVGLAGVAALQRGLYVTFSDIDELAVEFAQANARRNGFTNFAGKAIDLRSPPNRQWPILLGADLLYEPRLLQAVLPFIQATLAPGGVCLIADPDRVTARPFSHFAEQAGLCVERKPLQVKDASEALIHGAIYRITHSKTSM